MSCQGIYENQDRISILQDKTNTDAFMSNSRCKFRSLLVYTITQQDFHQWLEGFPEDNRRYGCVYLLEPFRWRFFARDMGFRDWYFCLGQFVEHKALDCVEEASSFVIIGREKTDFLIWLFKDIGLSY